MLQINLHTFEISYSILLYILIKKYLNERLNEEKNKTK